MSHRTIRSIFVAGALALVGCQGMDEKEEKADGSLSSQEQGLTCTSLIPVMSGNNVPSGVASASSMYDPSYQPWLGFDNSASFWLSTRGQTPAWLAYEFPTTTRPVQRYAVTYGNGTITSRAPKNWTLEAYNGLGWTILDTRTNQTGWAGHERREFAVANPGAYRAYRINVTDDNDVRSTGNVVVSISRLELYNCDPIPLTPSLWTRTHGAPGGFSRIHDLAGDSAGRTYSTGMTSVGLAGQPAVGVMDAFLTARDWNGNVVFHKQIGAPGTATLGYGVARNRLFEEIYVAGWTGGSLDGNPPISGSTAFLMRYRYTGVHGWTRQIGVAGAQTEAYGVAVDANDNAFLVGLTNGGLDGNTRIGSYDAFVVKYAADGTKLWTRQLGTPGKTTHGRRAAADASGNVYVSGWTDGNLDGNTLTGPQDAFVTKYDADGVKQWTRLAGAPGTAAYLYASQVDATGNVYLAGYSGGGMDGVPNVIPQIDVFVARYSPAGVKQWVWELDSGSGSWAMGLHVDATGIYTTGGGVADITKVTDTSGGMVHNYVAKLDYTGNLQWIVQQEPATLNNAAKDVRSMGVVVDFAGDLYVGGYVDGNYQGNTLQGAPDAFLSKIAKPL
ncbi:SBBP repeat-containing protein [Myxococcus sp. K38C18041901]|uniref:SBBP repeat-containing protein n=1 Tax=Myxococcus guangdongensis TaxID=2906760 RepID=UPI0020A82882|nr:SBBP repeat-containing protein [Myxococcus guangdongensis]MCP3059886.1 SBBP repeat-containing protein [Myxococcus guangdongensis]